jgi:hypothetical protein
MLDQGFILAELRLVPFSLLAVIGFAPASGAIACTILLLAANDIA